MSDSVPWGLFLKDFEPRELTDAPKVVSDFRDGRVCRLCASPFSGSGVTHVAAHAEELERYLQNRRTEERESQREVEEERRRQREDRRRQAVEDFNSGDFTEAELAEVYAVQPQTLRKWVRDFEKAA